MSRKEFGVESNLLPQEKAIPVADLASLRSPMLDDIEVVQESDVELEAFMNEPVLIVVNSDGMPGALPSFDLNVQGVKQRINRGQKQYVKRFFVESLARAREYDYSQTLADYTDLTSYEMQPMAQVSFPFTVLEDKNPKGRAWLENILRSR